MNTTFSRRSTVKNSEKWFFLELHHRVIHQKLWIFAAHAPYKTVRAFGFFSRSYSRKTAKICVLDFENVFYLRKTIVEVQVFLQHSTRLLNSRLWTPQRPFSAEALQRKLRKTKLLTSKLDHVLGIQKVDEAEFWRGGRASFKKTFCEKTGFLSPPQVKISATKSQTFGPPYYKIDSGNPHFSQRFLLRAHQF